MYRTLQDATSATKFITPVTSGGASQFSVSYPATGNTAPQPPELVPLLVIGSKASGAKK